MIYSFGTSGDQNMTDIKNLSASQAAFYARWLDTAGVHDCARETPVNFYQLKPQPSRNTQTQRVETPRVKTPRVETPLIETKAPDQIHAIAEAEKLASQASDLSALREALMQFDLCPLKKTARNLVFADGAKKAQIMLVGEAPGQEEDRQGLPFVGRSGQLLDKMLAAIGLSRAENIYITNILPWRPPGNRNPLESERALCRPFLDRHIELIAPKILMFLGGVAAKELLGTAQGIMSLRGRWHIARIKGREIAALPTLHPAYLLRQPAQKSLAWRDILLVKKKYETLENAD